MKTDSEMVRPGGWLPAGAMLLLAAVMVILGFTGCSSTAPQAPSVSPVPALGPDANAPLQEGDVISITCETVTNLNTVVKIPIDGMLNLAFIGQVQAAGKTPQEFQRELKELYQQYVLAEEITVTVVQAAASVYVSGAVLRPGKLPMERPMTALEAVMEAGGFDPNRARLSRVSVVRLEGGRQVSHRVNLERALQGKDAEPFYLRPFDTVHVPFKTINW